MSSWLWPDSSGGLGIGHARLQQNALKLNGDCGNVRRVITAIDHAARCRVVGRLGVEELRKTAPICKTSAGSHTVGHQGIGDGRRRHQVRIFQQIKPTSQRDLRPLP